MKFYTFGKTPQAIMKFIKRFGGETIESVDCNDLFAETPKTHEQYNSFETEFIIEQEDICFYLVEGGSIESGAVLKVAAMSPEAKKYILYIRPDVESLGGKTKEIDHLTFGVLKEYTRSGLFEELLVYQTELVWESQFPDVGILQYEQSVSEMIAFIYWLKHFLPSQQEVIKSISNNIETARLTTIGYKELSDEDITLFYPLKEIRSLDVYYYLTLDTLQNDKNAMKSIQNFSKRYNSLGIATSHAVYESPEKKDFSFCILKTSEIHKN